MLNIIEYLIELRDSNYFKTFIHRWIYVGWRMQDLWTLVYFWILFIFEAIQLGMCKMIKSHIEAILYFLKASPCHEKLIEAASKALETHFRKSFLTSPSEDGNFSTKKWKKFSRRVIKIELLKKRMRSFKINVSVGRGAGKMLHNRFIKILNVRKDYRKPGVVRWMWMEISCCPSSRNFHFSLLQNFQTLILLIQ